MFHSKSKAKYRFLAFLLAMLMLLAVGCGNNEPKEKPAEEKTETVEPAENKEENKEEKTEEKSSFAKQREEVINSYEYGDWLSYDENRKQVSEGKSAVGQKGVVSSQRYEASKIGVEIMKKGGNAIDAAVATAFALGVCEPHASGIGGGGFMTFRDGKTGEIVFIDFREVAPLKSTEDMFVGSDSNFVNDWATSSGDDTINNPQIVGGLAAGVPGEVAGLMYILENYGTMSRQEVMQPAIDLARNGYVVTPKLSQAISDKYKIMKELPEIGKIYLVNDLPAEPNTIIKNPDLAKTLEIIAEKGVDGFYKGEVADAIVASSEKYGGIISHEDLESYKINVTKPVEGEYRGYKIFSSPPPSSGGTHLIQILNILENFDVHGMKINSAENMHLLCEAFKIAYADRAEYMGDPNYVKVPLNGLKSKEYAKELAKKIDPEKSQVYTADDPWAHEGDTTTHLSVADAEGNMIGITKTVNYYFGSGVVVDGYGFILNNQMDDFVSEPGKPNSPAPGKKPLSSMSPTIILKDDKPFMVLGCPGGVSIFPQIAQVISNVIDHDMDVQEAIANPRVMDSLDNVLVYTDGIDEAEVDKLKDMGHEVSHLIGEAFGSVQGIQYMEDGTLMGGADPLTDAKAVGY